MILSIFGFELTIFFLLGIVAFAVSFGASVSRFNDGDYSAKDLIWFMLFMGALCLTLELGLQAVHFGYVK